MRSIRPFAGLLFLSVRCLCLLEAAEVSAPLGARLVEIGGNGATTILSSGGFRAPAFFGGQGTIEGTVLSDPDATWEPGMFAGKTYVELSTGAWALVVGNTVNQLTLESSLPSGPDLPYRLHRLATLDRLFGPNNQAGFAGGRHIGEADILIRWDNAAQATAGLVYFNTEAGEWQNSFNEAAGSAILYPDECLIVSGTGDPHFILLTGNVRSSPATGRLSGNGATNLLPNPFVFDEPIEASGLETSLSGGPDIGSSDLLAVFDSHQQLVTRLYYFNTQEQAWRDSFNRPLSEKDVIPAGSGIIAIRHGPGASDWRLEVPGAIEFTQRP